MHRGISIMDVERADISSSISVLGSCNSGSSGTVFVSSEWLSFLNAENGRSVSIVGFCFLILFAGNFSTTVAVVQHKHRNQKAKSM
ncbi:hypothetical protein DNTS_006755 [Danionella cerebrum]|uniref:Uncharacterized protein n=1 Tax=Danionella cerebrum TaxID=2873325 RepID=A0A553RLF9_9TELE|nr:hypothetical protein DNTS_006755 [Danionella translucida]